MRELDEDVFRTAEELGIDLSAGTEKREQSTRTSSAPPRSSASTCSRPERRQ